MHFIASCFGGSIGARKLTRHVVLFISIVIYIHIYIGYSLRSYRELVAGG